MEHDHDHGHRHGPHAGAGSAAMAALLDLDADVLHSYLSDVIEWVWQQAAGTPRHRVLDLGAGTGTGTIALARRFSGATVIAVDQSEEMLARVRAKALARGLADRVRTVRADLEVAWPVIEPVIESAIEPVIEPVDVVWASNSLHEMADPGPVLQAAYAAIRPGGLLAVAEMDAPPRFLPDDLGLGRPGLESRCHDALEPEPSGAEPRLAPDWGRRLVRAGFTLAARRTFVTDLPAPLPASAGRYAQAYLQRIRPVLEDRMAADDLATLDTLIDSDGPDGLLNRADLMVCGARTAWIARRPPAPSR